MHVMRDTKFIRVLGEEKKKEILNGIRMIWKG